MVLRPIVLGVIVVVASSVSNGSLFQIDEWSLDTGVLGTPPNFGGASISTISNPLQTTSTWISSPSSAISQYDFSWNDTAGDFLFQVTHRAADVDPGILRSLSAGYIYITTNADTLITIDANYSYSLPVVPMSVLFDMGVSDVLPPYDSPIGFGNYYDTWDGAPASGSFPASGQAILPGGHTWVISYRMEVQTDYGYSGQIASADGYLHFTLSEVPEPVALLPVALTAMLLRQSRK